MEQQHGKISRTEVSDVMEMDTRTRGRPVAETQRKAGAAGREQEGQTKRRKKSRRK